MELNTSQFLIFEFQLYKLSLKYLKKFNSKLKLFLMNLLLELSQNLNSDEIFLNV